MKKRKPELLIKRYAKLTEQLPQGDLILLGSVIARYDERRDAQGEQKTYGPYYQWTFKEKGKTVTKNLSAEQVPRYRQAIENYRRMEQIISKMRQLSREILEQTTAGVRKRNRS